MATTLLVKTAAPGAYAAAGVALTEAAAVTPAGNHFISSGKELVVAHNTGASPHAVTITSQPDEKGRTKDITAESIAAGAIHIYGPFGVDGWANASLQVLVSADNAEVKFGVIDLP